MIETFFRAVALIASGTLALQSKKIMPTNFNFQPKGFRPRLGWYNRGYIPHFDGGEIPKFFTFRLFDSLPQEVLDKWREETAAQGEEGKMIFRKNVENYLGKGCGKCFLKNEQVAKLMENRLLFITKRNIA